MQARLAASPQDALKTLTAEQGNTENLTGDPIEDAKRKAQMGQDAKTMKKNDFFAKYGGLTKDEKKSLGLGAGYDVKDIYTTAIDWTPEYLQKGITNATKNVERKAEEEKQLGLQAGTAATGLRGHIANINEANRLKQLAATKYGYNIGQAEPDYVSEYTKGILSEAGKRAASSDVKQGIPIYGDVKNENTCINGVCTIAANQGVNFGGMKGFATTSTNEKGQVIPLQNKDFRENIDKSGYMEIKPEDARPGDFMQYTSDGVPKHMEILLNKDRQGNIDTFNNYQLTNHPEMTGTSSRTMVKTPEGKTQIGGFDNAYAYRIKPETAKAAYLKLHPEYGTQLEGRGKFESSDDYKAYQTASQATQNPNAKILGADEGLFNDIVGGYTGKKDKETLKKEILTKSKNPNLVGRVIDQLYEAQK